MNCLRNWARYVHKGEVKGGGIKIGNESTSWILLLYSPFRVITISVVAPPIDCSQVFVLR